MKKYETPSVEVSLFEIEDIIMSGTQGKSVFLDNGTAPGDDYGGLGDDYDDVVD